MLIDSHCHIHDEEYPVPVDEAIKNAKLSGVEKFVTVGTSIESSRLAVELAKKYQNIYAAVGVHPHEKTESLDGLRQLIIDNRHDIYAIGEIGLDYHYDFTEKSIQKDLLIKQLRLASEFNLPIIFHVREAFDDFWPIFDEFCARDVRAVIHSFSDNRENLQKALDRGLYIGINGMCTFVKDLEYQEIIKQVPLDRLLLETDAPYLTPKPFRGKINEPAYIKYIAESISVTKNLSIDNVAENTTSNVRKFLNI